MMKFADAWEAFKRLQPLVTATVTAVLSDDCDCEDCKQMKMRRDNAARARAARKNAA